MIPQKPKAPELHFSEYISSVRSKLISEGKTGDNAPGVYVRTFGCQQNEADSERMMGVAISMGYRKVEAPEEAKLILVNTCAVREHAEKKALSIIGSYKHIKDSDSEVIIGVGGCMVTQGHRADKLKMSYPYVNFVFDTGSLHKLPELICGALQGSPRRIVSCGDSFSITEGIPIASEKSYRGWLSVMYGCNNFCSYCIVPYTRGRERSRHPDAILAEARELVRGGALDITLLGQNVNSFGNGTDFGMDISDLIREICKIPGDFRLRFMTSHPKDASDKLIAVMAEEEKVVPHFHLPIQSGSDDVLRRMNRKYSSADYMRIIEKLKAAVPDVSITSDIIVGFPGETDADFEDTLKIIREVEYDMIFSFIYSPRTGTPAATMEGQIPKEVSNERYERLLELQNDISLSRNKRFIGREMTVIADEVSRTDKNMLTGRGDPVRPIHFAGSSDLIGKNVRVKITDADTFSLRAEIIL
ncbi:MAG: tRNA (N6-isopentenyl adenosine(37)-C2)-methylthiotransferase MiaB [Ruminococcaceae bacterium]|nr:tRNA (N6-isopentenyl adenosine(37)-C2)-methylthiotransferase MiaB [Oscillospiraceae bacterium]